MARPRRIPDGILNNAIYFLAGDVVSAGVYWEIDGVREIWFTHTGILPASLDGRVAAYIRRPESLGVERQNHSAFEDTPEIADDDIQEFMMQCAG